MKFSRFYCERIEGSSVELDNIESHHLMHVMRLGVGSEVELFDGRGILATGRVAKTCKKGVFVDIEAIEVFEPAMTGRVIIASSIAKGQRFDLVISKCTELGADCIVPLIFERTVKQSDGSSVEDRYKKLSIVAAKQCGRVFLPQIFRPCILDSGIDLIRAYVGQFKAVYGGFGGDAVSLGSVFHAESDIIAFIGPEGGMTENEEKKLDEFGAVKVGLTETVLRTETATIAFSSILCTFRDDFRFREVR